MRIGLMAIGDRGWMGGVYYITNLIRAIRQLPVAEQPELCLISPPAVAAEAYGDVLDQVELLPYSIHPERPSRFSRDKELVKRLLRRHEITRRMVRAAKWAGIETPFRSLVPTLKARNISPIFPCIASFGPNFGVPWLGWAYDLQHRSYPEFFSTEEIARLDRKFDELARDARLVVLSSEHGRSEFARLWPGYELKLRVLRFHTVPAPEWYTGDVAGARQAYNLPERYLMLSNQFWIHKNHRVVFEALSILTRRGIRMTLVCTGLTEDHRHPNYFAELMAGLEQNHLGEQVRVLGLIPRNSQIQLFRGALAIIQPSLFEGWSTVLEDARALGKCLILSDIPVHREQNPDGAIYFFPHRPEALADAMERVWSDRPVGPDLLVERQAQTAQTGLVVSYARHFLQLAREAIESATELAAPPGNADAAR